MPAFLIVGVFWGMVYARWVEPRFQWPDWLEGALFSCVPLLAALLVIIPVIDSALPSFTTIGLVAVAGETIRHVTYGVVLGLTYPCDWRRAC